MKNNCCKSKGFHIVKFLLIGLVFISLIGYITMLLWNYLIPDLFRGPVITFWQALGLLLLGKLLFGWHSHQGHCGGRWSSGGWKSRMREKLSHMTPEQQEKMKERFRNCCQPGESGQENA